MRSHHKSRYAALVFVWFFRALAALILPVALVMVALTATGCSYTNRQEGEIGGGLRLFPTIVFDSNIEVGKQRQ
ncbi:hypothetical protein EJC49_14960 [Aquibium carbonis]|uniref:Uncharacterized protein n=1 Tax=Aquibium carbonis TaxID=2495581 RepID=A0A3R9YE70_9HYPH|nr:hypothetical protein [Aquibium carbonis]RST85600.1 hypothetical protein EJC49_14960 [Aquibium carbonis]